MRSVWWPGKAFGIIGISKTFPVILTDNEGENQKSACPWKTVSNEDQGKIFYCAPPAFWQKVLPEKNHEYIRKIIPNGQSLDNYTQKGMAILDNHIRSTAKASLNGCNPFELAQLQNAPRTIEWPGFKSHLTGWKYPKTAAFEVSKSWF